MSDKKGAPMPPQDDDRNMTDNDVKALADEIEIRLTNRFYNNLGRGLWGLAWKAIFLALLGVAAYGSVKGMK